jgi:hypothetical protein
LSGILAIAERLRTQALGCAVWQGPGPPSWQRM